MEKFKALRIRSEGKSVTNRIEEVGLDELGPGEVVIKAVYSSVNYKDALAATGAGKIVRNFPLIGGIDVAGTVHSSSDKRFKEGDEVICTSYDLGVAHDGGYSEYVRVPADWLVPLPKGMSLFDSMAIGTAGYTAALGIHLMEQNDLKPENGKVVVTGATGGVSSIAIDMLAKLGYQISAITGKESEQAYLKKLGASEILLRQSLEMGTRPMEKPLWAGAMDSVGGETLAWLTRTMQQNGVIGAYGNAGGIELKTTVFPFILRGVRLIGVDSVNTAMPLRRVIWERLAGDLKPRYLGEITTTVPLGDLPELFDKFLKAQVRGRTVVKINP
jgi:acrylyl-CoA reductase (NADPH)